MIHPQILVCGRSEAAMLLAKPRHEVRAIISIVGCREVLLETNIPHRLVLHFDDIEAGDQDDPVSVYASLMRRRAHGLENAKPPTLGDAVAVINFARQIMDMSGALLCQCEAGVSRSSAAALLCLAAWAGEGQEEYCIWELHRVRPCANPHRDMVRLGDKVLGRQGRLLAAVDPLR
jgi:predicted protein tyrosine phosphatase